jgi:hypothetical protein
MPVLCAAATPAPMQFNPVGQDDGKRWLARNINIARTGLGGKPLPA